MANLVRASRELFSRTPDETFDSFDQLYNSELLDMVRNHAGDFVPPQQGFNGATGLYAGEQDMFCDPDMGMESSARLPRLGST